MLNRPRRHISRKDMGLQRKMLFRPYKVLHVVFIRNLVAHDRNQINLIKEERIVGSLI